MRSKILVGVLVVCACATPTSGWAQSLRGSTRAMQEQNSQAKAHDFTFLANTSHVSRFVELGLLVPVRGNADYVVHRGVSFKHARPQVRTFVERLSSQYRRACGELLVVTSLTRPKSRQPRNSSHLSVHPTGMAVDLRRSNSIACRSWLENVLLDLENASVLEATRERRPPHYHVAVYPKPYERYVQRLEANRRARLAAGEAPRARVKRYKVRNGDSLWTIARAHGITVDRLKSVNRLRSSRIYAGQLLEVPLNGS